MRNTVKIILALLCWQSDAALADCVYGAKAKTTFTILDSKTIFFQGGYGTSFIVKVPCCVVGSTTVTVLKDNFCSYESAVLYINGEVVDVETVTKIQN